MSIKKAMIAAAISVPTIFCGAAFAEPVYLVATVSVTDWDTFNNNYLSVAVPAVAGAGGEFLVGDAEPMIVEGNYPHNWTVVVKFPSKEAAVTFYHSPEYEAVIPERQKASDTDTSVLLLAAQFAPQSQ